MAHYSVPVCYTAFRTCVFVCLFIHRISSAKGVFGPSGVCVNNVRRCEVIIFFQKRRKIKRGVFHFLVLCILNLLAVALSHPSLSRSHLSRGSERTQWYRKISRWGRQDGFGRISLLLPWPAGQGDVSAVRGKGEEMGGDMMEVR